MSSLGNLTVLTGPSGVGKGTIVRKILESHSDVWLSISATTRQPRSGEVEGKHYFFLQKKNFQQIIDKEGFLEWASFSNNFYGTPKNIVKEKIEKGTNVLLEIELEGARQIRKSFPEALQIFLLESVLGTAWVWFVINEIPPLNTIIGGALLLGSVTIFIYQTTRKTN